MNQENMRYVKAGKTKLLAVLIKFQISKTKSLPFRHFYF